MQIHARKLVSLVVCGLALAIGSQETHIDLPELGDDSSRLVTPHQEKQIGQLMLMSLRRENLVTDPLITYFVENNAKQIAQHSDLRDFELFVVIQPATSINAFAAPGGVIGINLGLILAAEDIHEYASVIAHEIAHLSQRHFARRLEKQSGLAIQNLVGFLASVSLIAAGGSDVGMAALLGTQAYLQDKALAYSRAQEIEADRIGFHNLVQAGYDPFGGARMFEEMHKKYRFRQQVPEYFSTHPLTLNRIADMRTDAETLEPKTYESSPDYQMIRARTMVITTELAQDALEVAESSGSEYHMAFALSQSNRYPEAISAFEKLYRANPADILIVASYAEVLNRSDQPQTALRALNRLLADIPGNYPLSMMKAESLERLARYDEAKKLLWDLARQRPSDHVVWERLRDAADKEEDTMMAHRANAEFYYLQGEFERAVLSLQHAKLIAGDSFRLNAILDQRILDIRELASAVEGR